MANRANISSGFRWRLVVVAFACLLYAGWSAYDGFVAYPRANQIADIFEQYKKDHSQWQESWSEYATHNGYPQNDKEAEQRKDQFSMIAQYIQLAITLPIGLVFAYGFFVTTGRWIESDENGIVTSGQENAPYHAIRQLNKRRWGKKGIAVVSYDTGSGEKRLVIDDWKYERVPTDQILRDIEAHIDRELIVGGDPEPELEEPAVAPPDEQQGTTEDAKTS